MSRIFSFPELPAVVLLGFGSLLFVAQASWGAGSLLLAAALISLALQRGNLGAKQRLVGAALSGLLVAGAALVFLPWSSSTLIMLLVGAAGWLKLAERSGSRDRFVAMLAGLWLIALDLLRLPAELSLYVVAATLAILVWALFREGAGRLVKRRWGWLVTVLPATFLAVILFVFTPRITGDLGMLAFAFDLPFVIETATEAERKPQDNGMSLDGLNQKSDGDMRVLVAQFYKGTGRFEDGAPPLGDLYWRGPVLWSYAQGQWAGREGWDRRSTRMRTKLNRQKLDAQLREEGNMVIHDISIFPHRGEWLYGLDLPAYAPPSAYVTRDWQLMSLNPVREVLHFAMLSFIGYRAGVDLDDESRALALQLPEGEEPRTVAFGRQLNKEFEGDHKAIALRGLEVFAEGFRYDRATPDMVGDNPVDAFLFDNRLGFGLQFATSYALMMRAAGVPTRLVAGYRGGTHMGLIERVMVLQRDAHAWTEIWLDDYGWVRMDPSARTVAAQRKGDISGWGLASSLPEEEDEGDEDVVEGDAKPAAPAGTVVTDIKPGMQWLTGFDAKTQGRMLEASGLEADWSTLILTGFAVLAGFGAVLVLLGLVRRYQRLRQMPVAQQMVLRFCRVLAKRGIRRRPSEGLRSYVARVQAGGQLSREESVLFSQAALWLCAALYGQSVGPVPAGFVALPGMSGLVRQYVNVKLTKTVR